MSKKNIGFPFKKGDKLYYVESSSNFPFYEDCSCTIDEVALTSSGEFLIRMERFGGSLAISTAFDAVYKDGKFLKEMRTAEGYITLVRNNYVKNKSDLKQIKKELMQKKIEKIQGEIKERELLIKKMIERIKC